LNAVLERRLIVEILLKFIFQNNKTYIFLYTYGIQECIFFFGGLKIIGGLTITTYFSEFV